jgi:hypothetical protein
MGTATQPHLRAVGRVGIRPSSIHARKRRRWRREILQSAETFRNRRLGQEMNCCQALPWTIYLFMNGFRAYCFSIFGQC